MTTNIATDDRVCELARLLAAGVVRHLRARRAAEARAAATRENLGDSDGTALELGPDSRLTVHDG